MRKFLAVFFVVGLAFGVFGAGGSEVKRYVLFGGSNTDSTEQASAWVPIRGASRVIIRTWSTHAAFHASTDADSTFSDSLGGFRLLLSDSIGTVQSSGWFGGGPSFAADSFQVPVTLAGDSAVKGVGCYPLPINKTLRGAANGSGLYTYVYPIQPGTIVADPNGVISSEYMRVRATPLRRMTVTGGQSTAGKRTVGLKGFRMEALVVRN